MNPPLSPRQDRYLTFTVTCPGTVIPMRPPHAHMQEDAEVRAGTLPIVKVGDPGAQGVVVTGMQGMGVSTPWAAAVADATWGFERVEHIPKGMMFAIGLKSIMVPAGFFSAFTLFTGRTKKLDGATPKGQIRTAPVVTS